MLKVKSKNQAANRTRVINNVGNSNNNENSCYPLVRADNLRCSNEYSCNCNFLDFANVIHYHTECTYEHPCAIILANAKPQNKSAITN